MAREMKDSGIQWIGEIPRDWYITKVGRIGQYTNGYAFKPTDWGNTGLPIIRIQNLSDSSKEMNYYEKEIDEKYHIHKGDYLISWSATLNIFRWQTGEGLLNQHIFKAIPDKKVVDYNYFYWLAKIFMLQMSNNKHGSAMQHVTNGIFNGFRIPLQKIEEQQRIAGFLDRKCAEIDKLILKTKSTIVEYIKYKQSVITEAVTKGLNPNAEMKDSGIEWIGKIPKHWDKINLRFLGSIQNGISKAGDFFGSGFPFVTYNDVYKNICLPQVTTGLVRSTKKEQELFSVKKGDVLFTRTSETIEEIGYSSTCLMDIESATFAGFLIRFRPNCDLLNCKFSKFYFRSSTHRVFFIKQMNIVTRASLSQELLKRLPVLLPPLEEQQQIADYLDNICAEIDILIEKKQAIVNELEYYKKSLIYEYVTGKKDIGEVQDVVITLAPIIFIEESQRLKAQSALMAKALDVGHTKKKFGTTEWYKTLYLLDACIGFPLQAAYIRGEYGPLLSTNPICADEILKERKWFRQLDRTPRKYVPTRLKNGYMFEYNSYFSSVNDKIEVMLNKIKPLSMNEVEKIATLYAVWNDFIINGKYFFDDDIINDVITNWSNRKTNFSKENWKKTLMQMRILDIVPKGYGKHTLIKEVK